MTYKIFSKAKQAAWFAWKHKRALSTVALFTYGITTLVCGSQIHTLYLNLAGSGLDKTARAWGFLLVWLVPWLSSLCIGVFLLAKQ